MKILKTLLKWIAILCGVLVATGLLVVIFDWPMWIGLIIFVAILCVVLVIIHLVRKKIYQYKTGFINKESEIDVAEQSCLYRYKELVETLEAQHHRNLAKNIKLLPWAIHFTAGDQEFFNAMKHYSTASTQTPDDISGMDVGAKWAVSESLAIVSPELSVYENLLKNDAWIMFLEEVCKWRPDSPFNKIVISLSLKELLADVASVTADKLAVIQQKIKQVYNITGFNVPVVIVFTDIQAIEESDSFLEILSTYDYQQSVGAYAQSIKTNSSGKLFASLVEQLNNYIDERALHNSPEQINAIYQFLANVEKLTANVCQVSDSVVPCTKGKHSMLAGLFFMGKSPSADNNGSLIFASDLFHLILPKQNFQPFLSKTGKERSRFREGYQLAILYGVYGIILLYILYAFLGTNQSLRAQLKSIPTHISYNLDFSSDLHSISRYHDLMHTIIEYQNRWTIKILPYHAGLRDIEKIYTTKFHKEFDQYIYPPLHSKIKETLTENDGEISPLKRAYIIENLVQTLNIIDAKLEGQSYSYFKTLEPPTLNHIGFTHIDSETLEDYGKLLKFYVWSSHNRKELVEQKAKILKLVTAFELFTKDPNLNWLIAWANTQPNIKPVLLSQFWHGSTTDQTVKVEGAYTVDGAHRIYKLIDEINMAFPKRIGLGGEEIKFKDWYIHQRLNAWYQFALHFSNGVKTLSYRAEWSRFFDSSVMLSTEGPYYQLLDLINTQFSELPVKNPPSWLVQIKKFYTILDFVVKKDKLVKGKRLAAVTRTFLDHVASRPSMLRDKSTLKHNYEKSYDADLQAAESFLNYQVELEKVFSKGESPMGTAYKIANALYYTEDEKSSPQATTIYAAYADFLRMQSLISDSDNSDTVFWFLIRGPLDFYVDYISRQASCFIQQAWQTNVLKPTSGLKDAELTNALFGNKGVVWTFASKYLQPYVQLNNNLFVPKVVFGHTFPFNNEFYDFLNHGLTIQIAQRELSQFEQMFNANGGHELTITSSPATVNSDAQALPYKVSVTTACKNKPFFMNNYNFRVSTSLKWKLGDCGPAKVNIYFKTYTLTKEYPGQFGFAKFIADFSQGPVTFTPADFPLKEHLMNNSKVKLVILNYKVEGIDEMSLKLENFFKANKKMVENEREYLDYGHMPSTISLCWNHSLQTKIHKSEDSELTRMMTGSVDGGK